MKIGDYILVGSLLVVSVVILTIFAILNMNAGDLTAIVTDSNGNVYEIELYGLEEGETYLVTYDGTLGDVVVEYKNGSIRVKEETSPQNICSKQGWSSSVFRPIVCLPNDFYITLESNEDTVIDGVIG